MYYYDIQQQNSHLACKFHDEVEYQTRLFGDLIPVEDKLYMTPYAAGKLYEVDIATGNIRGIEIDLHPKTVKHLYNEAVKFLSGHAYKDCIYLMPVSYPAIIEYNCLTGKISYYDEWISQLEESQRGVFFRKTIMVGSKIYAPGCMGNYVLEFDVETKQYHFFEVGDKTCSYSSICQVGEWFWLSPRGRGPIVKWKVDTNQWEAYRNFPAAYVPCEFSYADIVYFGGYIYCIPLSSKVVMRIEERNNLIESFYAEKLHAQVNACIVNHKIYFFSRMTGEMMIVDAEGNYECRELLMPEKQKQYHQKNTSGTYRVLVKNEPQKEGDILQEDYSEALNDYLQYVLQN
ncbi:MAG: hypothetical protein K2O32_10665 [Acetatifactor sp.]|nr:hypothetical protein [Acetatifactor sp.]